MTIYTRRGDHGETSLADGSRVRKDSARVEAYGDGRRGEQRGRLRARRRQPTRSSTSVLRFAQQRLFNCSAALATPAGRRPPPTPRISRRGRRGPRSGRRPLRVRDRPARRLRRRGRLGGGRAAAPRAGDPAPSRAPRRHARRRASPSTSRCSRSSTGCRTRCSRRLATPMPPLDDEPDVRAGRWAIRGPSAPDARLRESPLVVAPQTAVRYTRLRRAERSSPP